MESRVIIETQSNLGGSSNMVAASSIPKINVANQAMMEMNAANFDIDSD